MDAATGRVTVEAAPILLFDGACVLCDGSVRFIAARERPGAAGAIRFAALGSPAGRELLAAHGLADDLPDSVVLIEDGRAFIRSDAVLRVAGRLRPPWSWIRVFRWLPRPVRDAGYRLVAAVRYRVFGRKDAAACGLPPRGLAERILPGGLHAAGDVDVAGPADLADAAGPDARE